MGEEKKVVKKIRGREKAPRCIGYKAASSVADDIQRQIGNFSPA